MRGQGLHGLLLWMLAPIRQASGRALLFLLVALVNPFEIVEWSELRSHDLWQRIYAHCYPHSSCLSDAAPSTRGREAISVVYFDDASIARMGQNRPLPAFDLIDLIDDIRYAPGDGPPPVGIFVDMVLTDAAPKGESAATLLSFTPEQAAACEARKPQDRLSPFRCLLIRAAAVTRYAEWHDNPHCQDSTLAKLECIRRRGGIPLLFADPRDRKSGASIEADRPSASLDALGTVAAVVPVSFEGGRYALVSPSSESERARNRFELYPAAALYALWCDGHDCRTNPSRRDDLQLPAWSGAFDRDLDVLWGIGSDTGLTHDLRRLFAGALNQRCAVAEPGLGATLRHISSMAASGLNQPGKAACVYSHAVPSDIFQSQLTPQEGAAIASGKLVLIGAQFLDSNDLVRAPPFGSVPGLYFHAMALDNLIEFGARYPKLPEPIFKGSSVTWADPLTLLAIFLISLVLAAARQMFDPVPAGKDQAADARPPAPTRAAVFREATRRTGIVLGFSLLMVLILAALTGGSLAVPDSFNLVAATITCILGLGELVWDAIKPAREALKHRLRLALRVLADPEFAYSNPSPTSPARESKDEIAADRAPADVQPGPGQGPGGQAPS